MARRGKLAEVTAAEMVAVVNESGQKGAADRFDVSQTAVSEFLQKHKYRAVTLYLSEGETVTITPNGESVPFTVMADDPPFAPNPVFDGESEQS